jgi:hypothetical protein
MIGDDSLANLLHIPTPVHQNLQAKVADFIHGNQWIIPAEIDLMFPLVKQVVNKISIPL